MKFLITVFALSFSSLSWGADALCDNCNITTVQPDGAVPGTLIYLDSPSGWTTNLGSCSDTQAQKRMYILRDRPMGKELYAAALTSFSSNVQVDVKGTGECIAGIEVVRFIKLEK